MGDEHGAPAAERIAALAKLLEERYRGPLLRELRVLEAGLGAADPAVRALAGERLARMLTPFPPRSWDQVARPIDRELEPVVLDATKHPDAGLRTCAIELAPALTRFRDSSAPIEAVSARLQDPVPEVALAAARCVWLFARASADLAPVGPAVEEGLRSAAANVAFFCSLALSHQRRREGAPAPALSPPQGKPDVSGYEWIRSGWSVGVCLELPAANWIKGYSGSPGSQDCLACGNPDTRFVFYDSDGSNAGGTYTYGYRCAACGLYTMVEQEWG